MRRLPFRLARFVSLAVAGAVAMHAAGCAARGGPAIDGPYAVVLGTAQDGGFPQIGCAEPLCAEARRDPSRRRLVSSLLVADPRAGTRYLVDATPDLPEQVERARPHPATRVERGPRPPLFDGVLLTHAHVGHYLGLAHFGREIYGAERLPVFASERFARFLTTNGPWSLLVASRAIDLRVAEPDRPIALGEGLSATPLLVPHRDEFSDTFGYVIRGPRRALLYIPDIDKWEKWERRLEDVLATVDVALVDGTFAEDGEIPGRSMADIPHPFVVETLRRLATLPLAERAKVRFTHLNHTNPATDPRSRVAADVRAMGCAVAEDGEIHEL